MTCALTAPAARDWIGRHPDLVDAFVESVCRQGSPALSAEELATVRRGFLFRGAFDTDLVVRSLLHPSDTHPCAIAFRALALEETPCF